MNSHIPIKAFVINLDDSKHNYEKQKPHLEDLGLEVHRFSGINGTKDEHLEYTQYITLFALEFSPKSVIGCSLSHILLAKYISENYDDPYYLIFEDDAYPLEKYNTREIFNTELSRTINDINAIDPTWDIISLCSYALAGSTNNINVLTGCAAAYLINRNSVKKLSKQKVTWHHDIMCNIFYKKYKSKTNLFITDESSSTNRIKQTVYFYTLKKYILSNVLQLDKGISVDNYISYNVYYNIW